MASVKKGQLTRAGEWWKHLRWTKRVFWKAERQAGRAEGEKQRREMMEPDKAPRDEPGAFFVSGFNGC